jgi:hypothetical protein
MEATFEGGQGPEGAVVPWMHGLLAIIDSFGNLLNNELEFIWMRFLLESLIIIDF